MAAAGRRAPGSTLRWSSELHRGTASAPRARSHRRGARSAERPAGPGPEPLRARRLLAPLVGALRLQALRTPPGPAAERRPARPAGAGGERGRARPRRRVGGGFQGRVAQPPVGGGAVPGRCHRRRGHPARHRGDGRQARGVARRSAFWSAGCALLARGGGHRSLRELCRRPERRRRGGVRRGLRVELPRQRDVRRATTARALDAGEGHRGGLARRALRRHDGPRRDRRRVGARERRARRGRRGQAAVRADRRPLHRQEADRGLGGARGARARGVATGLRRGRSRLLPVGNGRRLRHRRPPRPRAAPRGGTRALGDHDL